MATSCPYEEIEGLEGVRRVEMLVATLDGAGATPRAALVDVEVNSSEVTPDDKDNILKLAGHILRRHGVNASIRVVDEIHEEMWWTPTEAEFAEIQRAQLETYE